MLHLVFTDEEVFQNFVQYTLKSGFHSFVLNPADL